MDEIASFTCHRCLQDWPLTTEFFHKRTAYKTGFAYCCKRCQKEYSATYYAKHSNRIINRVGNYKKQHREQYRRYAQKYYRTHKEQHTKLTKVWKNANKDKCRFWAKRWKQNNPQRYRDGYNDWKKRNPQKVKEIFDRYRKNNPEKMIERNHQATIDARERKLNGVTAIGIYERDGGKCHLCHRRVSRRSFTLDHIIPRSKGGPGSWENLAVAHLRCNVKRGVDRLPAQYRLF
jgi:5-methylcytosine-specific restriction endonuclease McrA